MYVSVCLKFQSYETFLKVCFVSLSEKFPHFRKEYFAYILVINGLIPVTTVKKLFDQCNIKNLVEVILSNEIFKTIKICKR